MTYLKPVEFSLDYVWHFTIDAGSGTHCGRGSTVKKEVLNLVFATEHCLM